MLCYVDVPSHFYFSFVEYPSAGQFYLQLIKPKFKLKTDKMSENQPKGINIASNKKRFIKMRLDVTKFNKDFFFVGTKGVYADITFMLLPDGEVDKFENCGMVVQDVPYEMFKKNKDLKGAILGNGKENLWEGTGNAEGAPGSAAGSLGTVPDDDLPF